MSASSRRTFLRRTLLRSTCTLPPDLDLFCCHAIRTENNFPVPMEIRTLEKYGQYVREMTARAGDVIIFPEALVCLPPSPSLAVGRP